MSNFDQLPLTTEPEKATLFKNPRGEFIDASLKLVTDPERGSTWEAYIEETMPHAVFQKFGLVDAEGSEDWTNLIEHSAMVAAGSEQLAEQLSQAGASVDIKTARRAGWVHDAAKRRDVADQIKREDEPKDGVLTYILAQYGYTSEEIAAARNTGRLEDRYIIASDESEAAQKEAAQKREAAIAKRTLEENIVGYIDARTRGSTFMTLDEARADSINAKPKDEAFFNDYWHPYYQAVEQYFQKIAPGFNPDNLDQDMIFKTVQSTVPTS